MLEWHWGVLLLNTNFSQWPLYSTEEAEAVKLLLLSNKVNYWTGNECKRFEDEFADWCGTTHAVALANGTLALDVALKALGVGPGDEVVVMPRTFIASISCVVNAGVVPVFSDVESDSGNISAQTIASVLSPRTKAVICVHLAGWPCNMDPIITLASKHELKIIEDCAQTQDSACEYAHYKCYVCVESEFLASRWATDKSIDAINAESLPCYQRSYVRCF